MPRVKIVHQTQVLSSGTLPRGALLLWSSSYVHRVHLWLVIANNSLHTCAITDTDAESGDSDDEFHQRAGDEKDFQGRVSNNCMLSGWILLDRVVNSI